MSPQAHLDELSIRYVKGVGPHRATLLSELGIETVEDALHYSPRRYEDRRKLLPIKELVPGEYATIRARVLSRKARRGRRGQMIVEAKLGDDSGTIQGLWFHQPYLAKELRVDDQFILYGRPEVGPRLQLIHPEMERAEDVDGDVSLHMERIVPIYSLTGRITQRWLRRLEADVLERYAACLSDHLPEYIRQSHDWPNLTESLNQLHFPNSWEELQSAQQRLSFDELFLLQIVLAQRRERVGAVSKPQRYNLDGELTKGLRKALSFTLTKSQERVIRELLADLSQPSAMHRLLQGDVGCGKTIVVIYLMAIAVQSGYQVALMAPTELLAEQHARVIGAYLSPLGVSVGLLSQGVVSSERKRLSNELASGKCSVIIGTHALIQRGVSFAKLALVVIDEQHKFGVAQRRDLARKAKAADVLVLTATPIPRTLALSLYGDLAFSTITELPPGRRPISTLWMAESERDEVYALISKHIANSQQGYVVYPLVEEDPAREIKAATQMAKRLKQEVFQDVRVGLLHGQMKPTQKERIMRQFLDGTIQLLVSTVIVEVGLDVSNATVMVIEHPERFGLAQLHQLRGRIGRGRDPSKCVVVSNSNDETVQKRLQAFVETTDGFALAEKDLELRGPGELIGKRQHGWLRFRIASLLRDQELLEAARREALELVERDPHLRDPSVAGLRDRVERFRQHPG